MKLGKLPYEHDDRTVFLGDFLSVPFVPDKFDFDKQRVGFPTGLWGNDRWQNGVICAQAHAILRLRRLETKKTSVISEQDVIQQYKLLTGAERPTDLKDNGLAVLPMFKHWRKAGFEKSSWTTTHTIAVYGELDPLDDWQLREACYLLGGVFLGFQLPTTAEEQYHQIVSWRAPGSRAGSWGGHLTYAKKYDPENFYVLTWGNEIRVHNSFIAKYCDEAWAVVNDMTRWRDDTGLDIQRLLSKVHESEMKGG